ncbi:hypothetical protein [Paeniglutamicibacter kerguelensis]|uniref:Uncharacterized protein n=1 Tax=Paeniglutamicibacter kerguelensis TaxID=254788 RepID=A0ABS4XBJ9_9MICC|nr:hypothetical protein [Paeniglutamicibacter kerguelensis]MBP2385743.1 hypothetical protein [Paeniglutamicibacter kerguelensis]
MEKLFLLAETCFEQLDFGSLERLGNEASDGAGASGKQRRDPLASSAEAPVCDEKQDIEQEAPKGSSHRCGSDEAGQLFGLGVSWPRPPK